MFRCVYCLKRKVWSPTDIWSIDHLVPQHEEPKLACDYNNLVFSCQFCNQQKLGNRVPDPCRVAYGLCMRVEQNGEITALNQEGKRLVNVIRLNHPRFVEERLKILRLTKVLADHAPAELEQLMSFPADLPNLASLKPPRGNGRPLGISQSHLALRQRGELPAIY
jgi:hypothetical protein